MTNELDEIRHLLEEFAMSIYPHGKTPVWNSVSDGVKDLIDYAKSLDDTEHRRRCRMSIDICPDFGDIVSELTAENEKLTARIAELEAERRWIPVSERLPEEDGQYLGCTNTGIVSTHRLVDGHFIDTYSCDYHWLTTPTTWTLESVSSSDIYVTHWMPLPEPPEVQE